MNTQIIETANDPEGHERRVNEATKGLNPVNVCIQHFVSNHQKSGHIFYTTFIDTRESMTSESF